ncbi:orph-F5 [Microplitis demolitor]|nr:orph-F5 [Microplitis demolitor]
MCTIPLFFENVELQFKCIVPREWESYSQYFIQLIILNDIYEYWHTNQSYNNAEITVGNVKTVSQVYGSYLWLRKADEQYIIPRLVDYYINEIHYTYY